MTSLYDINEDYIAVAEAKNVNIYDISKRKCLSSLNGQKSLVQMIIHMKNYSKSVIASCGEDKVINIWDLEKSIFLRTLFGHGREVNSIVYLGNYRNNYLASR